MPTPLHAVTAISEVTAESEGNHDVPDRRESPWADPKLWVSVLTVVLTIVLAAFGYIATRLSSIDTAVQAIVISNARQGIEIEALKKRDEEIMVLVRETRKLVDDNEKTQRDYNFNLSRELTKVQAKEK